MRGSVKEVDIMNITQRVILPMEKKMFEIHIIFILIGGGMVILMDIF